MSSAPGSETLRIAALSLALALMAVPASTAAQDRIVIETPSAAPSATDARPSPLRVALLAGEGEPVEVLERAGAAFLAGDYPTAIAAYQALIERGHRHALLYYDLGNAYLRQGELGRAIASYRRAAARAPRSGDVRANLAFARKSARDAVAPPEPAEAARTLFAWHYLLSPSELWLATAVLNALFWGLLAARLWWRSEGLAWALGLAALGLAICAGSVAVHQLLPMRVAVVLPREIDVRAGDRPDAVVRFKLHAGSEVLVRELRDDWVRIALPDGEQGWIERSQAEVVPP